MTAALACAISGLVAAWLTERVVTRYWRGYATRLAGHKMMEAERLNMEARAALEEARRIEGEDPRTGLRMTARRLRAEAIRLSERGQLIVPKQLLAQAENLEAMACEDDG